MLCSTFTWLACLPSVSNLLTPSLQSPAGFIYWAVITNPNTFSGFKMTEIQSPSSRPWVHSRGGGCAPSEGSRRESSFASSSFSRLQVFLGFWLRPSNLCPCLHVAFSSSVPVFSSSVSSKDTGPWIRDLPKQSRMISHLEIFKLITSAKILFPMSHSPVVRPRVPTYLFEAVMLPTIPAK